MVCPLPFGSQLHYNNQLLSQLRALEEKQLSSQREAADKQGALRQALAACDAARQEARHRVDDFARARRRAHSCAPLPTPPAGE